MEKQADRKPLVSILIPTYNKPEFFEQALCSALGQTYQNIEVIVCDNSTDGRTERLIQCYFPDARLRYVRNPEAKTKEENFMPFEHLAQGEYIQWLMHDDILSADKIDRMAGILQERTDVTLVTSQRDIIDQDGNKLNSYLQANLPITGEYRIFPGQIFGNAILRTLTNYIGEPSAVLFRRSDLIHHYWRAESRGYRRISDVAMWLELLEKGNLAVFREPLSSYRRHEGQEGQQTDVVLESRVEWYRLEQKYFQRRVFLQSQEEYHEALSIMLSEYPDWQKLMKPEASPAMWGRYERCMRVCERELRGNHMDRLVKITACLIAKNEAVRIKKWLNGAQTYADEIIMVDTGSTDETIELARQSGAEIYSLPWQDDFSAARNTALAHARGEWIIFLDADETFYHPEQVREILEHQSADVDGVQVPIINVDEDAGKQEIQRFPALRIWRNHPARRYVGRIHEALYEAGRPLSNVVQEQRLAVCHTGYSSRRVRAKLERNLRLIQQEIEQEGEQPRFYRYLADCCYGLGEYELALGYAKKAIAEEPPTVAGRSALYVLALEAMQKLSYSAAGCLSFAEQVLQENSASVDLKAYCGLMAAKSSEKRKAESYLKAFLLEVKQPGRLLQATTAHALLPKVWGTLGQLQLQAGDWQAAKSSLHRSLRLNRYDEEHLNDWEQCCQLEKKSFIETLSMFYEDTAADKQFLRGWMIHQGQLAYRQALAGDLRLYDYSGVLKQAGGEVQFLFQALYLSGRQDNLRYDELKDMLPEVMQHILEYDTGERETLQSEDADGYLAGLDSMLWCRNNQRLQEYSIIALCFDWPVVLQSAEKLVKQEEWELAFSLYQQVPESAIGETASFWHQVGVCLYHLGEAAAQECFDKAEAAGCQSQDIQSYRIWLKGGRAHD